MGGAAAEGVIADTSPLVVYDQLPDGNVIKPVATAFMAEYAKKFGPQSVNPFAGYSYDAMLLLKARHPGRAEGRQAGHRAIPRGAARRAGKDARPGRVSGVYDMSPTNHNGQDARAAVLVEVKDGAWRAIQ